MLRSVVRVVALALAAAVLLFGLTYVYLGTRLLPHIPLVVYAGLVVSIPAIAVVRPLDSRAGPVLGTVLLGALVFAFGVYGPGVSCNQAAYPDNADYGVTFTDGELRFGENLDGANYRCTASTIPSVAIAGWLLVSVGFVAAAFDWHTDPPWRGGSFGEGSSGDD